MFLGTWNYNSKHSFFNDENKISLVLKKTKNKKNRGWLKPQSEKKNIYSFTTQNAAFSPRLHNLQQFKWIYHDLRERKKNKVYFFSCYMWKRSSLTLQNRIRKNRLKSDIQQWTVILIYVTFSTRTIECYSRGIKTRKTN